MCEEISRAGMEQVRSARRQTSRVYQSRAKSITIPIISGETSGLSDAGWYGMSLNRLAVNNIIISGSSYMSELANSRCD